jgi:hypothetical protein
MKNVALSLAFLVSTLSAFAAGPGGDTVVVKMKNKNKVILITEKDKDLKSLKNLNMDKIMIQVDSSLSNLDMRLIEKDTVIKGISGKIGDKEFRIGKMVKVMRDEEDDEDDEQGERKIVKIFIKDGDTIRSEIVRRKRESKPKLSFFKKSGDEDMLELDLGNNNYLENGSLPGDKGAVYGLIPFNSNIVNLRWMKRVVGQPGKTRFSGSVGLELSWNNYKFDQNVIIGKDSAGVTFEPFDVGQKKIKSKLAISWLNVPLMLHYNSRKSSFHMALGGFAGYRLGSRNKIKFSENGVTKKEKEYTNFYLNSLQYGLRFQFGFHDVDFFAAYNLNSLFSSGRGPALTPISFGITL